MNKARLVVVVSWLLLAVAAYSLVSSPDADSILYAQSVSMLSFFAALGVRVAFGDVSEKQYWETALGKFDVAKAIGLAYMVAWLVYILYRYFSDPHRGDAILTDETLVLFLAPVLVMFIYYDVKWFIGAGRKVS